MHPNRILVPLAVAALLGGFAAAQRDHSPEQSLRYVAGAADIALLPCPPELGAEGGPIVLCGRYHYAFDQFQVDLSSSIGDLVPFGDWSAEDGTFTRTFLDGDAATPAGLYHVGFRNGAVMLTYYPRNL